MSLKKVTNWAKEHKKEIIIGAGCFVGGVVLSKTVDFHQIKALVKGQRAYPILTYYNNKESADAVKDYLRNFSGPIDGAYFGYNLSEDAVREKVSELVSGQPDCLYGIIVERKIKA